MTDDEEMLDSLPLVNTEKISQLINLYKVPIILFLLGLVLFTIAIVLILKKETGTSSVVFSTDSSPSAQTFLKIDVEGAVLSPGVYTLPGESRILDALVSAGGLSEKADRDYIVKNVNKAAKLVDGSKIYIPFVGESSSSLSLPAGKAGNLSNLGDVAGLTTGTVNINSASQFQLEVLPGVGPVTAGKIISGRPYQTIEELKSKKILGNALFKKIKNLIAVY